MKLLSLDVSSFLVTKEGEINKENLHALKRFQNAGNIIIAMTSYNNVEMLGLVKETGIFFDFYCLSAGSYTLDRDFEVLSCSDISKETVSTLISNDKYDFIMHSLDGTFKAENSLNTDEAIKELKLYQFNLHSALYFTLDIYNMSEMQVVELHKYIDKLTDDVTITRKNNVLTIIPKNVSYYTSLQNLFALKKLNIEDKICFIDSDDKNEIIDLFKTSYEFKDNYDITPIIEEKLSNE